MLQPLLLLLGVLVGSSALVAGIAQPDCAGAWTGSWADPERAGQPSKGTYIIAESSSPGVFNVTNKFAGESGQGGWKTAVLTLAPTFSADGALTVVFGGGPDLQLLGGLAKLGGFAFDVGQQKAGGHLCQAVKIFLDNGSVWCRGAPGMGGCGQAAPKRPDPEDIQKVFVVFSNHLDVGYTDNLNGSCAAAVINRYWEDHFPTAIATAAAFRATGTDRYRWMLAGSWISSMFRHCNESLVSLLPGGEQLLRCPNASALAAFEAAARRGDIGWHAMPFNAEPEVLDASLFRAAMNLTWAEDANVGHAKRITYSQRDVPGLTRAAIPLLAKEGVKAITVGENGACAPVNVPNIFMWRDNATQTEMLTMFHPRGYGRRRLSSSVSEEMDGLPERDWDATGGGLTRDGDCVTVPAAKVALCYAWQGDNHGPQKEETARSIFASARAAFPSAKSVVASDAFDDFVAAVLPFKATLPLVTAEIGDTWIHGADSDPLKVAWYRSALRQRSACLEAGECDPSEPAFKTFDRLLMKVSEHTWGWNNGDMRQPDSWDNSALQHSLATDPQYQTGVLTWLEQRSFVPNAVNALRKAPQGSGTAKLADKIQAEWDAEIAPQPFNTSGFAAAPAGQKTFVCGDATVGFGADGSITTLKLASSGTVWASAARPLASLWYQAMDQAYMTDFNTQYNIKDARNFQKPGLNLSAVNATGRLTKLSTRVRAARAGVVEDDSEDGATVQVTDFLLSLEFPAAVQANRGGFSSAEVLVSVPHSHKGAAISVALQWKGKTAFHGPETVWLSNTPAVSSTHGWAIDKLGSMMDPLDADLTNTMPGSPGCNPHQTTCGTHLHNVNSGVFFKGTGAVGTLALKPLDSGLVSVGLPLAVPTPLVAPDPAGGVHFALVGNIW